MFRTLALVAVSACATMPPAVEPGSHRTGAHLELFQPVSDGDAARQVFPRLVRDAELPSAQRLGTALLATQDKYRLGVRVCVAPNGAVTRVDLTSSSGVADLDRAALRDIFAWQYEAMPGPATVQSCAPMTLEYTP